MYQDESGQEFDKYMVGNTNNPNFENEYEFRLHNKSSELVDLLYAGTHLSTQDPLKTISGAPSARNTRS